MCKGPYRLLPSAARAPDTDSGPELPPVPGRAPRATAQPTRVGDRGPLCTGVAVAAPRGDVPSPLGVHSPRLPLRSSGQGRCAQLRTVPGRVPVMVMLFFFSRFSFYASFGSVFPRFFFVCFVCCLFRFSPVFFPSECFLVFLLFSGVLVSRDHQKGETWVGNDIKDTSHKTVYRDFSSPLAGTGLG